MSPRQRKQILTQNLVHAREALARKRAQAQAQRETESVTLQSLCRTLESAARQAVILDARLKAALHG